MLELGSTQSMRAEVNCILSSPIDQFELECQEDELRSSQFKVRVTQHISSLC